MKNIIRFLLRKFALNDRMYLGMAWVNGHKVVVSVGYQEDYARKKALEFKKHCPNIILDKIRIVRLGDGDDIGKIEYFDGK